MRFPSVKLQRGVTLIELLVALVMTGMITLATIAMYNMSSQSYKTLDGNQELQSRARFAFELITQAARVAGYEDRVGRLGDVADPLSSHRLGSVFAKVGSVPQSATDTLIYPIHGADNAIIPPTSTNNPEYDGVNDLGGVNASDTVAFRFFGSGVLSNGANNDGSSVDCQGIRRGYPMSNLIVDIPVSLFHVRLGAAGEPELQCIALTNPDTAPTLLRDTAPVVRGVETLQVMYGIDSDAATNNQGVPNKWVSAKNMTVVEWTRVRAIKVGLVIRGEPGSAEAGPQLPLYPLGEAFAGGATTADYKFTPPAGGDGRLRKAFNTTILLRNM